LSSNPSTIKKEKRRKRRRRSDCWDEAESAINPRGR
jgi:hypothetical protein